MMNNNLTMDEMISELLRVQPTRYKDTTYAYHRKQNLTHKKYVPKPTTSFATILNQKLTQNT